MRAKYVCSVCSQSILEVPAGAFDEVRLGIAGLTPEEREDIIRVDQSGSVLVISSICDLCLPGFHSNPTSTVH
ncbi:MAG: anti-sigma-F factor Fin [Bacillota bacterium]